MAKLILKSVVNPRLDTMTNVLLEISSTCRPCCVWLPDADDDLLDDLNELLNSAGIVCSAAWVGSGMCHEDSKYDSLQDVIEFCKFSLDPKDDDNDDVY